MICYINNYTIINNNSSPKRVLDFDPYQNIPDIGYIPRKLYI